MAEIYKRVDGEKIERVIARTQEAQDGMRVVTIERAGRAREILAAHRHYGHAKIDIEHGKIDDYIVLNDTDPSEQDPSNKAHIIEFGHRDAKTGKFVPGPAPLRKAVGLKWLDD